MSNAIETKPVSIVSLEVENLKRVKAVRLFPESTGLTIIGGKSAQGKTSVLDAIAWTLGGAKFQPSTAKRDGSMSAPRTSITLNNGLVVSRSGESGTLKVVDPSGAKAGQAILKSLLSELALDLPSFLSASTKEKAKVLLKVLGVGDELQALDRKEKGLYDQRHDIGVQAFSRKKYAEELPEYPDVETQDTGTLMAEYRELTDYQASTFSLSERIDYLTEEAVRAEHHIIEVERMLADAKAAHAKAKDALLEAREEHDNREDQGERINELKTLIESAEASAVQFAANEMKARAWDEQAALQAQYDSLDVEIEHVRAERLALLDRANLPLEDLTIEEGEIVYRGKRWDCMSGAEQLHCATAIVRADKPSCGFVLLDQLEKFDVDTLAEFGAWCEEQSLQVIGTRVSTGDECSIVIEDGLPVGQTYVDVINAGSDSGTAKMEDDSDDDF